jgi:hypothetical protein
VVGWGVGVEPSLRGCKKLAPVESGIKVWPGYVSLNQWKSCLFSMFYLFPDFEHCHNKNHLNLILQLPKHFWNCLGIFGNV